MLRVNASVSPEAAMKYYNNALAKADYYAKGEPQREGMWGGRVARVLGLEGAVLKEEFEMLAKGRSPGSGERLCERKKVKERSGYDFTLSVPKSVSLYWAKCLADQTPEMIEEARRVEAMIQEAFRETMVDIESRMETRVRKSGADADRVTGNLAYAAYTHTVSRPVDGVPDPHYHIHSFVFSLTFDEVENRWKRGQFGGLKRDAPFYEAAFHARLADRLIAAGFAIRRTENDFELATVSDDTIRKFSRRTAEIERWRAAHEAEINEEVRRLVEKTGMAPRDAQAKVLDNVGARTRKAKASELSPQKRLELWKSWMTPDERRSLDRDTLITSSNNGLLDPELAKGLALEQAFERVSVCRPLAVAALALRRAIGRLRPQEAVDFASEDPRLIQGSGGLVTTDEALKQEQAMIGGVVAGRGLHEQIGNPESWDKPEGLSADQGKVVRHLLDSRDLVASVRGPAGAGKTTMMRAAVSAIEELGKKEVIVLAPSSSGADELRKEGFVNAQTFQRLEVDQEMQKAAAGKVLWVDEAGFLAVRQMEWIVNLAQEHGCRVILSGDTRQHHSVERGDALRILEATGAIDQASLTEIHRQRVDELREAMKSLAGGRTEEGFERLDAHGVIQEIQWTDDRLQTIADIHLRAVSAGRTSLIVSPTHSDGRQVARAIRSRMREKGMLNSEEYRFRRMQNLGWTVGARSDAVNYEPGMVVEFHRKTRGTGLTFLAGEQCEVKRREGGKVVVDRNGVEQELPLGLANSFGVYAEEDLTLSAGDQIRATKNFSIRDEDGKRRCRNNALLTVADVSAVRVVLSNGMELQGNRRWHLDQGWVVTSHAAQGKTVDQVIGSVPIAAFSQANEAQFYVSMSRARSSMHLFTDSKKALLNAVLRPADRMGASEIVDRVAKVRRRDFSLGMEGRRNRASVSAMTLAPETEKQREIARNI